LFSSFFSTVFFNLLLRAEGSITRPPIGIPVPPPNRDPDFLAPASGGAGELLSLSPSFSFSSEEEGELSFLTILPDLGERSIGRENFGDSLSFSVSFSEELSFLSILPDLGERSVGTSNLGEMLVSFSLS